MLVLTNLGVVSFDFSIAWQFIYPIFFVIIGMRWLFDYFRKRGGSWVFGSFFLIFGSLLLLDRFEIIYFTFWSVFKLWPLLIVYFGFMLIRAKPNIVIEYNNKDSSGSKKTKSYSNSFFSVGDHEFNEPNWKVTPINLRTMAGDFYFDFSKAFIPEKEIPVTINCLAGDVNILMPSNVEFRVEATLNAGEIVVLDQTTDGINRSLSFETEGYEDAERKIDFQIHLRAGAIRIDHV
ncbi:hypothetical protein D8M05_01510 [Oceanobacillus bengalensis]|uniref:Cell wall-active antibiotics response LiaF-like C-terminal domain-containing protein n=2 Tax=Oceanobacillus bengalensis TaxID=1435466 RepID=A0A494Z8D0_9BACI|nr:hypothetical protein D8M05_01510 [Oceanobacillus bengalensis]